ncbi:type II secretion system F family protein [Aldersonia sp. NBC_00410]|uniref:type II secretion system F family protein n=1 Tax=Aldersonia sp. NBC_00410 TaxID=2975954 RepID=UPI002259A530|nr:type II secretion system F family protein [Aldersonia sp. NBC_00410]MCX5043167.1 type II secretion system F family protein [Aldersonia sp. NBC_00410]
MTVALLCAALAVLVAPPGRARIRFAATRTAGRQRRRLPVPAAENAMVVLCVPAALVGGLGAFLAASLLTATVRTRMRRNRIARRRTAQRKHLLDGLEIVIAELRVGAHPATAASAAAAECSGSAARAFEIAAARARLGGSAADGVRRGDDAIAAELGRIADAWRIAEEHGLALAELLEAARRDLLARIRFGSRVDSALAGARATAAVLAALPILGIGLGQLMGAAPVRVLLGGGAGAALLVVGTGLACAGLLWSDAITRRVAA